MNAKLFHASCVAWQGRGALILGRSGAGKSALALQLMALGADLVSDDRTELLAEADALTARAPATIQGLIEARGVGLMRVPFVPQHRARHSCLVSSMTPCTSRARPLHSQKIGILAL